jgi:succinoglycan biosynthesis protein ExoA
MFNKQPTVTIAIPTYNEELNIENILKSFLENTYENVIEIIVSDGQSSDETVSIVKRISLSHPKIKVIENPKRLQYAGLNLAIEASCGEIFLRADAHSKYAPNYVEKCVETLTMSNALNVGGAQRFLAKNTFQSGVALASKSIMGNGGAKYRDPMYTGVAETVYLGCFWKNTLVNANAYSEMDISEDFELNQRLREIDDNAIYISSDINVGYYPRDNWKGLLKQYFKYGQAKYKLSLSPKVQLPIRTKVPLISFCIIISLAIIAVVLKKSFVPIVVLLALIFAICFFESIRVIWSNQLLFHSEIWQGDKKKTPSTIPLMFCTIIAMISMPSAYLAGYLSILIKPQSN